jgi:hypothetical protein
VFFTPRGKALFAAPPPQTPPQGEWPTEESVGVGEPREEKSLTGKPAGGTPLELRPAHLAGAPRWNRDSDIPWALEARAWEALDPG